MYLLRNEVEQSLFSCQTYFIPFLLRLIYLNELILQGNQLRLLPPEFTQMEELIGNKGMLLMAENPWILPFQEQLNIRCGRVVTDFDWEAKTRVNF